MINDINPIDVGIACIVCIGYISGKLWIYYKGDTNNKGTHKHNSNKGVIKRGPEWD